MLQNEKKYKMTTQEKIDKIIQERYNNYTGVYKRSFKELHRMIRDKRGDEWFLNYLEEIEEIGKPDYKK
jgi:hypothetical protein